jgi:hypothetical protein
VIQQQQEITVESRLGRALRSAETVLRDWHAARAAATPAKLELARPECGYTATFVAEPTR